MGFKLSSVQHVYGRLSIVKKIALSGFLLLFILVALNTYLTVQQTSRIIFTQIEDNLTRASLHNIELLQKNNSDIHGVIKGIEQWNSEIDAFVFYDLQAQLYNTEHVPLLTSTYPVHAWHTPERVPFLRFIDKPITLFDQPYHLQLTYDAIDTTGPIRDLSQYTLAVFLSSTLIIILALTLILRSSLVGRFKHVIDAAKAIGEGHLEHRIKVEGNDEIVNLSRTLNEMAENLSKVTASKNTLNTEIEQKNQAMRMLSEQKYALDRQRLMIDTMGSHARVGAWEVDLVKNTVYWSAVTKQIHEVSDHFKTPIEQAFSFFKPGESKATMAKAIENAINQGSAFSVECQITTAKDHDLWIHVIGQPDFKEGVCLGIMGSIQDIQERKEFELDLVHSKELAEAAVVAKSNFLANMSHEIRTPMNGVIGMIELVNQSSLTDEQSHRLDLALSSANSLLAIINDILDFSKIEAGKMELEVVDFNFTRMLEELLESMSVLATPKNIKLTIDNSELKKDFIRGDPTRIRQILTNLVSNAIKFTAQGSVLVRCSQVDTPHNLTNLRIDVIDTGVGIASDKTASLFEPFQQEDVSTTRNFGGTGLGLSIVSNLVECMKGTVTVTSQLGQGSQFTVNIPVGQSTVTLKTIPQVDLAACNALIVSEDAQLEAAIVDQLNALEVNATLIKPSLFNRKYKAAVRPNFIFCVLDDPRESALPLIQKILQNDAMVRAAAILVTPNSKVGDGQIFADMGFHAYVTFPSDIKELRDILSLLKSWDDKQAPKTTSLVTRHMVNEIKSTSKAILEELTWPRHLKILLVEDNQTNTLVAKGILKSLGLQCDTAINGQDAVKKVENNNEHPYSLIFMDCQMPIMDGFEATLAIRKLEKLNPENTAIIIAMTANAMTGDKEACLSVGMNDYIAKPIHRDILMQKIQAYFSEK
ncbi:ATP-binding protein [Reinekea sp.]|jgi:signal transduction histidine kinase/CheY-like chemotaxis protein/HAMP domain-containing protein|uniref:ATP-binding protein n=1 Tax=Reinekea sp. TaxID=1970455 RepID=UPI003989A4EA